MVGINDIMIIFKRTLLGEPYGYAIGLLSSIERLQGA